MSTSDYENKNEKRRHGKRHKEGQRTKRQFYKLYSAIPPFSMHLFYHQSIRVAYGNFIYNGIVSNDMQLYICALIIRYHMNGGHEFQKRNETAEKNIHTHTHMLGRRC